MRPAEPTNGRPAPSSSVPGASPTMTTRADSGPRPMTGALQVLRSSQSWQSARLAATVESGRRIIAGHRGHRAQQRQGRKNAQLREAAGRQGSDDQTGSVFVGST